MEIRQGRPDELQRAIELDWIAFSQFGTDESPEIIRSRQAVFAEGFLVAVLDGGLVGFSTSEKWEEYTEPSLNRDPQTTHSPIGHILCITDMVVDPLMQGRGIGTALLQQVIQLARQHGCAQIVLETSHAQNFYMKEGFSLVGQRTENNTTLLILMLDLERNNEMQPIRSARG